MSALRRVARTIRHLPGLRGAEGLWCLLRDPYHRLLDGAGGGVSIMIGGLARVSIPAEFAGGDWEGYEPEAVACYVEWVRSHPGALILDVGSSIGVYSAIALFANPTVDVVAFDSDVNSLAAARRLCRHAPAPDRLRLVHGLVADIPTASLTLDAAVARTGSQVAIAAKSERGAETRYVCLGDPEAAEIAHLSIDGLLGDRVVEKRPVVLKCDVEGAELLVLSGARGLLARAKPALLVSVHPAALSAYGHTKAMVQAFLVAAGYRIDCVAIDHEEHWWCVPVAVSV